MAVPLSWDDVRGNLPDHEHEMAVGHEEGRPTMTEQAATHGTGRPAEDRGIDDRSKLR